jgi:predicted MFS family arabinose efflux permease
MKKNLFILNIPLLLVELLTILLLVYIAYGEANRKFENFQLGKMAFQAEMIKNSMDSHLNAGMPLEQFSGFNTLSEAILKSDQHIKKISIIDTEKTTVFSRQASVHYSDNTAFKQITLVDQDDSIEYQKSNVSYRVILPLIGKFGVLGKIEIDVSQQVVKHPMTEHFTLLSYYTAIVFIVFSILVFGFSIVSNRYPSLNQHRKKFLNLFYIISFVVISSLIAISIFNVYEKGASSKIEALSNAMAHRINAILDIGIKLDDIDGLNNIFSTYKEKNPEISMISLSKNRVSIFNTDPLVINKDYVSLPDSYEYRQILSESNDNNQWELVITIPNNFITDAIFSKVNEFLVLMLACGLISWIFLDASTGLSQWLQNKEKGKKSGENNDNFELGLKLIKPAYFLIVFTSALPVSFLPQLVTHMAEQSGSNMATATLPFTIFYFIFAAVLIPAGRYAERIELKKMMAIGFVAELIGLFLIAVSTDYWMLTLGRAFSGFAQGVFLIGLSSYTLSITPKDKRTQGAAVKVNGRNAALISGTAIGALLYSYVDYQMIFIIAVSISLIGILYLWRLVPSVGEISAPPDLKTIANVKKKSSLKQDLILVIKDAEFVKTLILVGLIGKMAITGVIMFAIPLILAEKGLLSEDIGQLIMLYYIASIIVTRFASRYVDASGASQTILIISSMIGGIGIIFIGITGINQWEFDSLFFGFEPLIIGIIAFNNWLMQFYGDDIYNHFIILGIILAGISNGMMAAPIMTHIDKTDVAQNHGNKTVAASYLFLERGGHVVGPMVISFMLLFTYQTTVGIALFGLITLVMSIIFMFTSKRA